MTNLVSTTKRTADHGSRTIVSEVDSSSGATREDLADLMEYLSEAEASYARSAGRYRRHGSSEEFLASLEERLEG